MSAKKSNDINGALKKFNKISSTSNFIFNIFFILFSLMCVVPLIFVAIISISSEQSIQQYGYQFIPNEFSFKAYQYLWDSKEKIFTSVFISIIVTVGGTIIGLFLNATMGYVISRRNFKFKNFFTYVVFIPMLFNGGMISFYLIVSKFLGLKDNILALILPMAVSSFYIIVLRTFFKTSVPDSIIESAKIDGASQLRIFFGIVLPISLPALSTIGLFLTFAYWNDWFNALLFIDNQSLLPLQALIFFGIVLPISLPALSTIGLFLTFAYWNDWFNALLFIDNQSLLPLQALLMRIEKNIEFLSSGINAIGSSAAEILANLPSESAKMAIVMIVVLPIACTYPFFQKYFISGLTIGAVKE